MWLESKIYACLEGGEFMQIIKKYWFIFVLIILLIVAICFYVKTNKKEEVKNDYTDNKIVVGYAVDEPEISGTEIKPAYSLFAKSFKLVGVGRLFSFITSVLRMIAPS